MNLKLKRPIVFFDLEATGVNVASDRIVEYSFLKINTQGEKKELTARVNPQIPIPIESSVIHGIYDDDVKDCSTFKEQAQKIKDFIRDCDLGGFNSNRYDIPLLAEEFLRAGVDFTLDGINTVDVQVIFHKMEQRTLSAAYKFYCKKELENAHSANADIVATYEVLEAQVERYKDLGNTVEELTAFSSNSRNVDFAGRMVLNDDDDIVFNFGKHRGKKVSEILKNEPSYYNWMLKGDFPLYTKKKLKEIKERLGASKLLDKFNL